MGDYVTTIKFYKEDASVLFYLINTSSAGEPLHTPIPRIGEKVFSLGIRYIVTDVSYEYKENSTKIMVFVRKDD